MAFRRRGFRSRRRFGRSSFWRNRRGRVMRGRTGFIL